MKYNKKMELRQRLMTYNNNEYNNNNTSSVCFLLPVLSQCGHLLNGLGQEVLFI